MCYKQVIVWLLLISIYLYLMLAGGWECCDWLFKVIWAELGGIKGSVCC